MITASYCTYPLHFHKPSGTSRGVLVHKPAWFVRLTSEEGIWGLGEVAYVPGLSPEVEEDMEIQLDHLCKLINRGIHDPLQPLPSHPGIQFAFECAMMDLSMGGTQRLYDTPFTRGEQGISTNGLIWMGNRDEMIQQVKQKVEVGFRVLKLKVGALDFQDELKVLTWIRQEFLEDDLEIRLDANGAWQADEALERLTSLESLNIHSLEQPIAPKQHDAMAEICRQSPIPIALDEELIVSRAPGRQEDLLRRIDPHFLILKPGLLGGFKVTKQWIDAAGQAGKGWWITSSLESSVGLNAIAQWTSSFAPSIPQGLGTGMIYKNNITSPLHMKGSHLWYQPDITWDLHKLYVKGS